MVECKRFRKVIVSLWLMLGIVLLAGTVTGCQKQKLADDPVVVTCEACAVQVEANDDNYAQGEPITVTVTVSISDDTDVSFDYNRRGPNFKFYIFDEQGQEVQMTEFGMSSLARVSYLPDWGIFPDRPFQEVLRIDELFELSEPGTYTLIAEKRLRVRDENTNEFGYVEVRSEPFIFTRLPD